MQVLSVFLLSFACSDTRAMGPPVEAGIVMITHQHVKDAVCVLTLSVCGIHDQAS